MFTINLSSFCFFSFMSSTIYIDPHSFSFFLCTHIEYILPNMCLHQVRKETRKKALEKFILFKMMTMMMLLLCIRHEMSIVQQAFDKQSTIGEDWEEKFACAMDIRKRKFCYVNWYFEEFLFCKLFTILLFCCEVLSSNFFEYIDFRFRMNFKTLMSYLLSRWIWCLINLDK